MTTDQVRVLEDVGDGRPGWDPPRGTPLLPGLLAWDVLAMGHHRETWLCWSADLWVPAVVKVVRPRWSAQWTEALDREHRALNAVRHPAVPRLLVDGRAAPTPHLVVEYLDGPSLEDDVADKGLLPAADAARLGVLLLGAVRALHATGHAHLDISPGNVLLVGGRPRLIDLGASRPLGSRLVEGEELGTDGFQAPELVGAPGAVVTPALDVASVGAVLRSVLDPASDAADVVADRLGTFCAAEPGHRPDVAGAMSALRRYCGTGAERPWPYWAERALPRAPRHRRPRVGAAGAEAEPPGAVVG